MQLRLLIGIQTEPVINTVNYSLGDEHLSVMATVAVSLCRHYADPAHAARKHPL
jgi:hypothetical protein